MLQREKKLVVEASRDHAKSWTFSFVWPLFNLQRIRDPKQAIHIALISYSEDQARKNLQRIRKAVESNDNLSWLVPKSKAYVWESSQLDMSNGCTLEAFGFGSSIRGGHYDIVIIDDPTKDHFTMSLTEQENFLYGVIIPAVKRTGQIVVTGNPVEKKDLLFLLENNTEFKTYFYPAIDKEGNPLWPEQYDVPAINAKRRLIPPHIFAREYMLKRVNPADSTFKPEWIHYYEDSDINAASLYKVMTIDPAISPNGDALAAVVTGTDSKDNTYVLERMAHRGEFGAGVTALCNLMKRHAPNRIGIETFAFQRMYKVWLEDEMKKQKLNFSIEAVGRDARKSKAMRIHALQPKMIAGQLFFKHDQSSIIDQFLMWDPTSERNEDDEIDALAWQVGMWQSPAEDYVAPKKVRAGSMQEAINEVTSRNGKDWLSKLFEDMAHN